MPLQVTLLDQQVRKMLAGIRGRSKRPPVKLWRMIQVHSQAESQAMFLKLSRGGTHRGVRWDDFSPNYIGQKRPSGQRVDSSSKLLRDTGFLSQSVARELEVTDGGRSVSLTTPVLYAGYQQAMRPFSFFIKDDAEDYARMAAQIIVEGR